MEPNDTVTMSGISYFPTAILQNDNHQTIITGLLIGLVIEVAVLVLLAGTCFALHFLDKSRPHSDFTDLPADAPKIQVAGDPTDAEPCNEHSVGVKKLRVPPCQQPTIMVHSPSEVHPALRSHHPQPVHMPGAYQSTEYSGHSAQNNSESVPPSAESPAIPQALMPGRWDQPPEVPPRHRSG